MADFQPLDETEWGYRTPEIAETRLIDGIANALHAELDQFSALPNVEPANDKAGYRRIYIEFRVTPCLYNQFFNGRHGYRAHYYHSIAAGEALNSKLAHAVADLILATPTCAMGIASEEFCRRSLYGTQSKFWFSREISDPCNQGYLATHEEAIQSPRWFDYWRSKPKPRKGLFAPQGDHNDECRILFNGTFANDVGEIWVQKPGRSLELHNTGWV